MEEEGSAINGLFHASLPNAGPQSGKSANQNHGSAKTNAC